MLNLEGILFKGVVHRGVLRFGNTGSDFSLEGIPGKKI